MSQKGIESAFSLTEVLVILAIILALGAILLPILAQTKRSAMKVRDLSHLRQVGTALLLYRDKYEHAESGTAEEMGLPTSDTAMEESGILASALHPTGPNLVKMVILYTFKDQWESYSRESEGSSALLGELSWTDPKQNPMADPQEIKDAAVFYIDGHTKRFSKRGDPLVLHWWSDSR